LARGAELTPPRVPMADRRGDCEWLLCQEGRERAFSGGGLEDCAVGAVIWRTSVVDAAAMASGACARQMGRAMVGERGRGPRGPHWSYGGVVRMCLVRRGEAECCSSGQSAGRQCGQVRGRRGRGGPMPKRRAPAGDGALGSATNGRAQRRLGGSDATRESRRRRRRSKSEARAARWRKRSGGLTSGAGREWRGGCRVGLSGDVRKWACG
jgi:hypothetical protein